MLSLLLKKRTLLMRTIKDVLLLLVAISSLIESNYLCHKEYSKCCEVLNSMFNSSEVYTYNSTHPIHLPLNNSSNSSSLYQSVFQSSSFPK